MIFNNYLKNIGKRYTEAQVLSSYSKEVSSGNSKTKFQVTDFLYENKKFSFYERVSTGFLSKQVTDTHAHLLLAHKEIIEQVGVIQECYNASSEFIENLQEIFTVEKDEEIWKEIRIYIEEKVKESSSGDISIYFEMLSNLTIFAYETNGNCFMYDSNGIVYLYAPDHSYNDLVPLPSWPEYTLYSVPKIKTFEDFVQLLFTNIA